MIEASESLITSTVSFSVGIDVFTFPTLHASRRIRTLGRFSVGRATQALGLPRSTPSATTGPNDVLDSKTHRRRWKVLRSLGSERTAGRQQRPSSGRAFGKTPAKRNAGAPRGICTQPSRGQTHYAGTDRAALKNVRDPAGAGGHPGTRGCSLQDPEDRGENRRAHPDLPGGLARTQFSEAG